MYHNNKRDSLSRKCNENKTFDVSYKMLLGFCCSSWFDSTKLMQFRFFFLVNSFSPSFSLVAYTLCVHFSISRAVGSRPIFRNASASSSYHAQRTIQSKCHSLSPTTHAELSSTPRKSNCIHLLINPLKRILMQRQGTGAGVLEGGSALGLRQSFWPSFVRVSTKWRTETKKYCQRQGRKFRGR